MTWLFMLLFIGSQTKKKWEVYKCFAGNSTHDIAVSLRGYVHVIICEHLVYGHLIITTSNTIITKTLPANNSQEFTLFRLIPNNICNALEIAHLINNQGNTGNYVALTMIIPFANWGIIHKFLSIIPTHRFYNTCFSDLI